MLGGDFKPQPSLALWQLTLSNAFSAGLSFLLFGNLTLTRRQSEVRLRPSGVLTDCPTSLRQPLLHPLLCRPRVAAAQGPRELGILRRHCSYHIHHNPYAANQQLLSLWTSLHGKVYFLVGLKKFSPVAHRVLQIQLRRAQLHR